MYHIDHPAGIVFDDELLGDLDEGWVDSPAKLSAPKEDKPKTVKKKAVKKGVKS